VYLRHDLLDDPAAGANAGPGQRHRSSPIVDIFDDSARPSMNRLHLLLDFQRFILLD
jgi:hypothetical protein